MKWITLYKDKMIMIGIGVLVAAILGLIGALYVYKGKVEDLSKDIQVLNVELVLTNTAKEALKNEIEVQNKAVEANKNEYDTKLAEYQKWKDKPAEIKYKTVIKEVKSDECVDIKNALDELSTIKF